MSVKKTFLIGIGALLIAHMMINTYFPNVMVNSLGIIATSFFIYYFTLRKNDFFSYIMVMYICTLFPYLSSKGGGFNLVAMFAFITYFLLYRNVPFETKKQSKIIKRLVFLLSLSTILGWIFNFTGTVEDLLYSSVSFFGIITLLMIASSLIVNKERVAAFIKVNFILVLYSFFVNIIKFLKIVTFETPLLPFYGTDEFGSGMGDIESGGIIGNSPMYGQHSMLIAMLFISYYIVSYLHSNQILTKKLLLLGIVFAIIGVFMSISKAVFISTVVGVCLIYIFQTRIVQIDPIRFVFQFFSVVFISFIFFFLIKKTGLDYVFHRIEVQNEYTENAGGMTFGNMLDGTAFNRGRAFNEASIRYKSRIWFIGYGFGLPKNNLDAFYVYSSGRRGSAHSQYYATLFIFGWFGFFAFWALHILCFKKSIYLTVSKSANITNRIYALFSAVMIVTLMLHGITADNIYTPSYFGSTMILLGLSFANINTASSILFKKKRH